MKKIVRGKTEYGGLCTYIPHNMKYFSQVNINDILYLDESSPDIHDLIKVHINSNILNNKIVKTPIGESIDGLILTGWKLLSECSFDLRLDYTPSDPNTSIYTTKYKLPFTCGVSLSTDSTFNSRYIPSVFIEDIYSEIIDSRSILVNINLIFTAENY